MSDIFENSMRGVTWGSVAPSTQPDEVRQSTVQERMAARREIVRQAREQFRQLPEDVQRQLKADYAAANERAAEIVRRGQIMRPAQPVRDTEEGRR